MGHPRTEKPIKSYSLGLKLNDLVANRALAAGQLHQHVIRIEKVFYGFDLQIFGYFSDAETDHFNRFSCGLMTFVPSLEGAPASPLKNNIGRASDQKR